MKTSRCHLIRAAALGLLLAVPAALHAANYTKADNTNSLDQGVSWAGGTAPGASDIANWSGTYSADPGTNSLRAVLPGNALTWQGIMVGAISGTALTTNTFYASVTNLSAATESGNLVTITTKANHAFAPGQSVTIAGVTPAEYNGTFTVIGVPSATSFTYSNATAGLAAGTAFGTAQSAIYIGGAGSATAGSALTIGTGGIDLSAANVSVTLAAASFAFSGDQTWHLLPGQVLHFGASGIGAANAKAVTSGSDGTITISGGGIVDLNEGGGSGFSDAGGFTAFAGNWIVNSGATLRGLRNGATAFGSSAAANAITLDGGTLAVGGISGDVGNWTWNTLITLAPGTTSYIDEQNVAGSGRYLKLNQIITGSGNLVFKDTAGGAASTFTSLDTGYILTGANDFSGTLTIGGPVENGIAGRLTPVRVGGVNGGGTSTAAGAGTDGTLGTGNVINNGVLTFMNTAGVSVPNLISGTGTLRIGSLSSAYVGTAYQTVTLLGANTYTGPTVINAGTLALGATGSIADSSSISIPTNSVNGGAVVNTLDVSALAGGFTTAPGQTLNLNGGQVTGTLNCGLGSTNLLAPAGGNTIGVMNISGDLNLAGGSNTLVLDINNTANDQISVGGNLTAGGVTTLQFIAPVTGINAGTYTLIMASGTVTATPANFAIAGLASGPRTQTFSIVVNGNQIQLVVVGSPGNLTWVGDGVNNIWSTATTFSNWFNNITSAKDIFVQNDQVAFDDSGSSVPAINLTGILAPGSVTVNAFANDYTLTGSGQIAGATGLTVSGTRMLSLLTSNTFTGPIAVNAGGILAITNEAALNQPTNPSPQSLTLDNGSALMVTNNVTIGANTNRGIIIGTGGGTLMVTNGATLSVSSVIGDLTGVSVLTETGNGTLDLNGNNNYGGGTIINGGTVVCGNSHAMGLSGNWSPGFTLESGVVDVAGQVNYLSTNNPSSYTLPNYLFYGPNASSTPIITFAGNPSATMMVTDSVPGHAGIIIYGSSSVNQAIYYNGANNPGKAIFSAPWYGMGSGAYARTFQVQVDPTTASPVGLEIQGQMSGLQYDGKFAIIQKTGDGVLEISATNYFPNLQVTAGTLLVNNPWALGVDRSPDYSYYNPSIGSVTNVGSGGAPHQLIVDGGTVDLNGFSPEVGALNDNGGITTGVITNSGATPSVLTLGYSVSNTVSDASYAGIIASGAQAVSVVKTGTNTQVLAGINTYSGTTVVNNGTLLVNAPGQIGLGNAGSPVTVAGGTLGGSGIINAPTVIQAAGTLAPGAGAVTTVTLTVTANLTLGGTNIMNLDKDTATNDLIVLNNGTINYGGVLVVSTNLMTSTTLALGDSFQLFSAPAHAGNFSSISGSPGAGLAWSFNPTSGVLSVVNAAVTPVPLNSSLNGSTLTLSWPGGQGWRLECQTNGLGTGLSTNWLPLTDSSVSSTNITIDPAKPTVFYRLVNP